jgi:hypothetical protein
MEDVMANPAGRPDLLSSIAAAASPLGIAVRPDGDNALAGEMEAIKAKWFLGGNKTVYRFSCRLDEPSLTATFRESIFDKSWGIAPPTLKIESYSQHGTTVSSSRREKSVGGGGGLAFGQWREACADVVARAGWKFRHEPMGIP